ncbi:MAG: hypothetical protein DMF20_03685 [Verrucomicrobia bacterium]|nr:MAG: hypothetical protein DMF20_03685 [Verrucomicrobiota bacterium]
MSFGSGDFSKKNFFRMAICSGVVRSNCTTELDSVDAVNSGSVGADGCSMIAPIGALCAEFNTTVCPFSAICLRRIASRMPPPRFVKRSSMSEFRSVSIFSAKLGPDSGLFGVASEETDGGDVSKVLGVAVGDGYDNPCSSIHNR